MRPQQNRRIRGRSNNNRRAPNPLTRNYESNGPDVKIRGNAQHIAEKYAALARDAQASGDRVMAENYLQHAEHYMRIILAAQAQSGHPVLPADTGDEGDDGESPDVADTGVMDGSGPQPVIEGTPSEVARNDRLNMGMEGETPADSDKAAGRPRRVMRRRLPDRAEGEAEKGDEAAARPGAEEPVRPRRGRRPKAVEDAAE
ncbi:MAG: Hypothetical protein BHV28_02080 [Candidatus Tokpelaia hoelldobleri]|uniref:DUF4167 domain-containing protein n=1 Tax=Candidatus Tokpelaia hoelldobleri TaxID=1902579 RepID=A0A1U9JSU3_9HYPH|nr:MAG: Hypothetical protein BHV28_02080 [Candidatus Tokpelaia hoelldoblerii]